MFVLPGATTIVNSPRLPPTRGKGNKRGELNLESVLCIAPLESDKQRTCLWRANTALQSSRRRASILICASALNARCASEQTQTVTRKAPTMTHMPTKDKLPDLDDGGTGLPPRDDGDGGGGGGGGGGNYSGGFFFFGFLAFLGFLKDKETEDPNERRRRR